MVLREGGHAIMRTAGYGQGPRIMGRKHGGMEISADTFKKRAAVRKETGG